MTSIKTRELNKGSIKTIDRASALTQHIRDNAINIKDTIIKDRNSDDNTSPEQYAQQRIADNARRVQVSVSERQIARTRDQFRRTRTHRRQTSSSNSRFPIFRDTRSEIKVARDIAIREGSKKAKEELARKSEQTARAAVTKSEKSAMKTAKLASHTLRDMIASAEAMMTGLSAAGVTAVVVILVCVMFGAALYFFGDESSSNYTPVSAEVEAYSDVIKKYAGQYGISEYTELIKAVMMQESGGRGKDPMQCSECGLNTKYSHKPNSIKDPEYSIDVGTHYLSNLLKQAGCESPLDMEHIRLALQGYNYGGGYIDWAIKRDGGYTVENAIVFSDQQAKKHNWSSYGDKQYAAHVLRYYPFGSYNYGIGNAAIVKVAAEQIGNVGGDKFWKWYGFKSHVAWCACFVSWCADQCGYIKSGTIPKFSNVRVAVRWFQGKNQWQKRGYSPAVGDIIFFDWDGDGLSDHVGIVESVEKNQVHTIEGNSGNRCRRKQYYIKSGCILGYGVPRY